MYTIKQAATRAGVTVHVLRAWERRYGIVRPERTDAGYRLYDEAAIERLRAMRSLVGSGWSPSQAAREIETNGVPPRRPVESVPAQVAGAGATTHDLGSAFVDAASSLDERRVETVLDDLFAGGSFERVIDDRIMPALRALGEAWAAGTVSVAAEHAASHAVLRRISASFEAAGGLGGEADRPVLVGLPPDSRHEIGALAFATAARRRGLNAVYLGADVPLESWSDAIAATRARAAVIAIPMSRDRVPARNVVQALSETAGLLLAVGGSAAPGTELPPSVLLLSDGIAAAAATLERAIAERAA
jgi:DNA-binding transcriptional MerR regulator/methylmalonyl-CoA mutase cobalamin-binding subunit